jgi:hypothetical protein
MIPTFLKQMIIGHLKNAVSLRESSWGVGISYFLENAHNKKDIDFIKLLEYILDLIKINEQQMRLLLGESFSFFNSIELVKYKATPLHKMILEGFVQHIKEANERSSVVVGPETSFEDILREVFKNPKLKDETIPTPPKNDHISKVSEAYESLKDSINNVLSDMQPMVHMQEAINPRIEKIFKQVQDLRDLACTKI